MSSNVVETAISLDRDLWREAPGVADQLNVSPTRLFATAMAEYLERRRNRERLGAIDTAHDIEGSAEARRRRACQRGPGKAVRGE